MTSLDFTFPKRARLTNKREITAVLRRPRARVVGRAFEILAAPNGLKQSRLGVIVGRAFDRRSTRRNCFKRCAREAYRLRQKQFKSVDILVRARTMTHQGVFREELREELDKVFDELNCSLDASHPKRREEQSKRSSRQNFAVRGLLRLVSMYRLVLSPLLGGRCRFYPTCSRYAMEAVTEWGAVRGLVMTAKRLFKCHPFHPGGYDPVPAVPGRGDS